MKCKIVSFALVLFIAPTLAKSAETTLTGHRAVYELSFDSANSNSGVVGAEGRYVFDLEDACEGYAINERLVVKIDRAADNVLTDYRLTAFESTDGSAYRFSTKTEFNGRTGHEADGNLIVDADADTAEVDYTKSDDVNFEHSVLTPIAHVRAVLAAAVAGETRHAAMIFDGDVDAPIYYAATRISEADEGMPDGAEALSDLKRWKIDSVYFPPDTGSEGDGSLPKFAFGATIFENGIVADLRLDYIDFALNATLSDLEVHNSGC